jgi:uncharacterized cupin superfamily protein
VTLIHWDEVEGYTIPERLQPLGGRWQRLGDAAGSIGVGVQRVFLGPGQLMTPPHVHGEEEEIFYVLSGSATLWQDGSTCVVAAGDAIVHVPAGAAHTLVGGDGGLEVLVFGERLRQESGLLPRTGVAWLGGHPFQSLAEHPWGAEAALGLPEGTPGDRPPNVVNVESVEGEYGGMMRGLGAAGGAQRSGLNWVRLPPGEEGAPPHCHSVEEELFVAIDGEGALELWGPPRPGAAPPVEPDETRPLRAGSVVARPPGTRVAHSLRAGESGLTYLAYGTRRPEDIAYYPRSNKLAFRGLGLIGRLAPLDYFDGEPE